MGTDPSLSAQLARLCRDIADHPLPAEVVEKAKLCLLDHLAALLYGTRSPMDAVGRAALASMGSGAATVIGRGPVASAHGAAFFHGLIATAEDLDDSHRFATGIHLSAVTFAAALALAEGRAESRDCSGERLLKSVVAGYEVAGRLSRAVDGGLRARGLHSTGAVGPFGACAASGVVLEMDEDRLTAALGIAASGAGGLFAFLSEGASVRHAHGAWAAANGLTAAILAASGMTGPSLVLEGKDGYFSAFTEARDASFIEAPSPTVTGAYEILSAYHKIYACCGHAFPSITAALALREALLPRLPAIAGIEARVYKASAALTNPDPRTVDEAKFSLPFILGIALVRGDVGRREMTMENVRDPMVRDLAARVKVVEDPAVAAAFPGLRSAELLVTLTDGSVHRTYVDAPLGMPENPVGWKEIEEKFRDAADGIFSAEQATRISEAVRQVDRLGSIVGLMRLLGRAER